MVDPWLDSYCSLKLDFTVEGPAAGFPGAVEAVDVVLMGVAEAPDAGC